MMKLSIIFIFFLTVTVYSCFIGADTYEKAVNEYFFLYSVNNKTDNVCLGTIDDGHRIGDGYNCLIKKAGWDTSFLIFHTKNDQYYIQDLKELKQKQPDEYKAYLYGPFNKKQFDSMRDSLQVDKSLSFSVEY